MVVIQSPSGSVRVLKNRDMLAGLIQDYEYVEKLFISDFHH
jgi:hypothetical protein